MKFSDVAMGIVLLAALVLGGFALHHAAWDRGYKTGFFEGVATKQISTEHKRLRELEARVKELETQVKVVAAEVAEHRCRHGAQEKRCPCEGGKCQKASKP